MCCIGGMIFLSTPHWNEVYAEKFCDMLVSGEDRGIDSTGIVFYHGGKINTVIKRPSQAEKFVKDNRDEINEIFERIGAGDVILTNSRAQPLPEGDSLEPKNRQPIVWADMTITHNGTIPNDKELTKTYHFTKNSDVDSEVILHLLNMFSDLGDKEKVERICSEISGGIAIVMYDPAFPDKVYMAKNFKPLHIAYSEDLGCIIFNSEQKNIEVGFGKSGLMSDLRIERVPPYTGIVIDINEHTITEFPIQTKILASVPESDPKKVVVVCSGGVDSSTAAMVAKKLHNKDVTLIHFDYGQMAKDKEWESVNEVAKVIGAKAMQVDLSWLGKLGSSPLTDPSITLPEGTDSVESTKCWVPARNLVMLSITSAIAEATGASGIYSGFNLEESGSFPDNDIEFLDRFNELLDYGTLRRPKLTLVLERLMKGEIIALGHALGVPFDKTWSCDRGGEYACGVCGCCWTRRHAFIKSGIEDGQKYLNPLTEKAVWLQKDSYTIQEQPLKEIIKRMEQFLKERSQ